MKKVINKKAAVAVVIMILITVLLYVLSGVLAVEKTNVNESLIKVQDDGRKAVYSLNIEKPETQKSYFLNLKTHGCTVKVLADGNVIYEYGEELARNHKLIGKIFSVVPLTESAYNGNLIIETVVADTEGTTDIETVELCDANQQQRYFVTNETLGGLLGPVFLALAVLLIVVALFVGLKRNIGMRTLLFGFILLGMAGEIFDTGGHYLIFMDNQYIWNIIFQIDSLLLPTFCIWFFGLIENTPISKRVAFGGVIINFCILAVDILAALLSPTKNILDFRFLLYAVLAVDGVVAAVGIYWLIKKRSYSRQQAAILFAIAAWFVVVLVLLFSPYSISTIMNSAKLDPETIIALCVLYVLSFIFAFQIKREYEEKKEQEQLNFRLEAQLSKMQMQNFNSQMQPHFLYNALSSIKQIIYENPNYAATLISDFTIHLRGTIRAMANDQPIPFSEELKNIKAYVSIEKVRFGEKLTVNYDIQADDFQIIPLSVQPLVENAIRHGVYRRGENGGTVTLKSTEISDQWIIQVIDNGVGFDVKTVLEQIDAGEKDSTGLKNLVFRLENLMNAKVQIDSVIGKGTTVTVNIPKRIEGMK